MLKKKCFIEIQFDVLYFYMAILTLGAWMVLVDLGPGGAGLGPSVPLGPASRPLVLLGTAGGRMVASKGCFSSPTSPVAWCLSGCLIAHKRGVNNDSLSVIAGFRYRWGSSVC